jgi:hypothetical protein
VQRPHSPNPYLPAFVTGTGAKTDGQNGGMVLSNTTYFVPFGGEGSLVQSVHISWDNVVAGTITVEVSNNPDATIISTTAGEWVQENPSTAYVGGAGSGGLAVANLTLTITAGTGGGAIIHLGNNGTLRSRLKVTLTAGGRMSFMANGAN